MLSGVTVSKFTSYLLKNDTKLQCLFGCRVIAVGVLGSEVTRAHLEDLAGRQEDVVALTDWLEFGRRNTAFPPAARLFCDGEQAVLFCS